MLTAKELDNLAPKKTAYRVWDGKKNSFGVRVSPGGTKTFFFFYRYNGKRRFKNLGKYDPDYLTLKQARDKAREFQIKFEELVQKGFDPEVYESEEIERREAERLEAERERQELERRGSMEQLIDIHINSLKTKGRTDTHIYSLRTVIKKYISKSILKQKAAEITPAQLAMQIRKPVVNGKYVVANRLRAYLHSIFQTGLHYDNDPRNIGGEVLFGIKFNPVSAIPKQQGAEGARDRELNFEEIALIWKALNHPEAPGTLMVKAQIKLQFLLAGMHFTEVGRSRWKEFDLGRKVWEIPAKRSQGEVGTKNKRPFILPLCDMALNELKTLQTITGNSEYVFTSRYDQNKPMSATAPTHYVRKQLRPWMTKQKMHVEYWSPANIRSTVKTRLGELGFDNEQRNRLQNHAQTGIDVKHYDRWDHLDEKSMMLETWETAIQTAIEGKPVKKHEIMRKVRWGNVLPLHAVS